jgi:hypothetical protein
MFFELHNYGTIRVPSEQAPQHTFSRFLSAERYSFDLISNVLRAGSCVPQVEVLSKFRRVSGLITD